MCVFNYYCCLFFFFFFVRWQGKRTGWWWWWLIRILHTNRWGIGNNRWPVLRLHCTYLSSNLWIIPNPFSKLNIAPILCRLCQIPLRTNACPVSLQHPPNRWLAFHPSVRPQNYDASAMCLTWWSVANYNILFYVSDVLSAGFCEIRKWNEEKRKKYILMFFYIKHFSLIFFFFLKSTTQFSIKCDNIQFLLVQLVSTKCYVSQEKSVKNTLACCCRCQYRNVRRSFMLKWP